MKVRINKDGMEKDANGKTIVWKATPVRPEWGHPPCFIVRSGGWVTMVPASICVEVIP